MSSKAQPAPGGAGGSGPLWWKADAAASDDLGVIAAAHDRFARETAALLGQVLRAPLEIEGAGASWEAVGDVLRAGSDDTLLIPVELPGAPSSMLLTIDRGTALRMVDRMLGGTGARALARPPTDLEVELIGQLAEAPAGALSGVLRELLDDAPRIEGVQVDARLVRLSGQTSRILVLRYRLALDLPDADAGRLSVCYPASTAEALVRHIAGDGDGDERRGGDPALPALVHEVPVDVAASLQPCRMAADDLRRLDVGDVLMLDHHRDDAVVLTVGGIALLGGVLGKRRNRVAVRVDGWADGDKEPT